MNKRELIKEKYSKGMPVKEIADELGITKAYIYSALHYDSNFISRRMEKIKRPYLKDWMMKNHRTKKDVLLALGLCYCEENLKKIDGKSQLKESEAKKLKEVTGLSYEKLFTIR